MTNNNITYPIHDVKPREVKVGQHIAVTTALREATGLRYQPVTGIVAHLARGSAPGGIAATFTDGREIPLQNSHVRAAIFISILADDAGYLRDAEVGTRFKDRDGDVWERTALGLLARADERSNAHPASHWGNPPSGSTLLEAHERYGPFTLLEPEPEPVEPKREPGYYHAGRGGDFKRVVFWDGERVLFDRDGLASTFVIEADLTERLHTYDPETHVLVERTQHGTLTFSPCNSHHYLTPSEWAPRVRRGLEPHEAAYLAGALDNLAEAIK